MAGLLTTLLLVLPLPLITAWLAALPEVGSRLARRPPLWTCGPPRPESATTAAVLGFVASGCTFPAVPFVVGINLADGEMVAFCSPP